MALDPDIRERIIRAVDAAFAEQIAFTAELVRHESTRGNEAAVQEFMAEALRRRGLAVDKWHIDIAAIRDLPGFSPVVDADYAQAINVVATHHPPRGAADGRSLIINGHVDVVPPCDAARWQSPPFVPRIADGWMYGRGAGDMKAGLAAAVFALDAIRAAGFVPASRIHIQSVVEEECTGNGTLACLQRGYTADCAFIPEPFGPVLQNAQGGVIWFRVHVPGDPQHASAGFADVGANAIEKALALWPQIKALESEWNDRKVDHPHFRDHPHPIRVNLGMITGGDWTSSVPATAVLGIRAGVFPGVDLAMIRAEIADRVATAAAADPFLSRNPPRVEYHGLMAEGNILAANTTAEEILAASHHAVFGESLTTAATTATTDARFFGRYQDTPAILYGPICERPHGIDERVELESVRKVTQTLALFIAEWCGIETMDNEGGTP